MIAEFVPVGFRPDDPRELREVERESDLQPGDIESAKWMKAPANRREGQRVAHLLVNFSNPKAANDKFYEGMVIRGCKVSIRRLLPEPTRCLKCQKINPGHIAATCPHERDICGSCGGDHRTAECTVQLKAQRYCINCRRKGHAAWERDCPHFMGKLQELRERNPDTALKLFPEPDKPSRWELNDWRPAASMAHKQAAPTPPPLPTPSSQQRGRNTTPNAPPPFQRQDSAEREAAQAVMQKSKRTRPTTRSRSIAPEPGQRTLLDMFTNSQKSLLDEDNANDVSWYEDTVAEESNQATQQHDQ